MRTCLVPKDDEWRRLTDLDPAQNRGVIRAAGTLLATLI
jgi:hypothetical protein